MNSWGKILGGILLVSGTTIGAGMLALPICTGLAGFFPSLILFFFYWLFMTFTAFLFLEVNLWFDDGVNIISMAKQTLGRWGQIGSWIVYLFLLYSLTTAYIAGGGPILTELAETFLGIKLPHWVGIIPLLMIFGYFVFRGTRSVDYLNRLLMIGLVVTFIALTTLLIPHENLSLLTHIQWNMTALGVSVVATSFGFHIIIPSLTTYLQRDVKQLKIVILIGSIIPLMVYILWNFLTLGIIPIEGTHGLIEGYVEGTNGAHMLALTLNNPLISLIARCFSFFAIVTSFLGVSLSLMDFLSDGLAIKKSYLGRGILYCLTFFPPLIFTLTYPRAFLVALEYAGAFGVILLLGVLPILMVWKGRYAHRYTSIYEAPGGKKALTTGLLFSAAVIGLEIANQAGLFKTLLTT